MAYGDLSTLLSLPRSTRRLASGALTLAPAALAAAKLLTIRVEKGGKDKLLRIMTIDSIAGTIRSWSRKFSIGRDPAMSGHRID